MKPAQLHSLKKTALTAAVIASLGTVAVPETATASAYDFSFSGVFTMLDPAGTAAQNTNYPYYGDPTWAYGYRTQISGTVHYDTTTKTGTATIAPFNFFGTATGYPFTFRELAFQSIGNGTCTNNDPSQGCQPGNLLLGNMLYDWNMNFNNPVSIVWDASGMLSAINGGLTVGSVVTGTGATPASNSFKNGSIAIGPAPMATTTWNTTLAGAACTGSYSTSSCLGRNPSGQLPLIADTVGGSPMLAGPLTGFNINLDVISMTVTSAPVPVPAAVWLFGSGLLGLTGIATRHRRRSDKPA